jgi:hypothetical protein
MVLDLSVGYILIEFETLGLYVILRASSKLLNLLAVANCDKLKAASVTT